MPAVHLSGQHNVTFVHIPKSAGTSVGNWIVDHADESAVMLWWNHPTLAQMRRTCSTNFSIAVVRNPWDRLVSMYHYAQFGTSPHPAIDSDMIHEMFIRANNYKVWPTFDEWVSNLPSFYTTPNQQGMDMSQMYWIGDGVDLVIKMETIEQQFEVVQEMFKCGDPLPKQNTTNHGHYSKYYDARTRDLVARWFKRDIEAWHYEF